jgi:copper chaperone CopZ
MKLKDKPTLLYDASVIRNERSEARNTAMRVGKMFIDLINAFDASLGGDGPAIFPEGIETGVYEPGVSGGKIDSEGDAEFRNLLVRLKALLGELEVKGDAVFDGSVGSPDFVSGFPDGSGWGIVRKEILNALGVPEYKYSAEFDEVIVRGALRIFSLVASQLLGENDNRVFTAMAEVDHYDPATGRVWLDTKGGKLYNPFRKGDYIMVQQYTGAQTPDGYISKHYELIITGAGCGDESDGEERLDWVTFGNYASADGRDAAIVITKGDTFTRVDSATDADRKGLIQIMTVGAATPYMDVVYGLKTDPANALKGRLGNLEGVRHHLFGWLQGFGEMLTNLYAVGDFRLRRTGESLDSKIEMLRGVFESRYRSLTHDITENDNYLTNPSFAEQMAGWEAVDDGQILTSNGEPLLVNGNTFVADDRIALIEEYEGKGMLHLKRSGIRQRNALVRQPGTHREFVPSAEIGSPEQWRDVKDTLYLSVKIFALSDGVLSVGFEGSEAETGSLPSPAVARVTASGEWQTLQWQGTWDGKGDFVLEYTGEAYISLLSLTDCALDDFKREVSTSIEQTSDRIRLLGTNIDNISGKVTQLGIDLDAANGQIELYAKETKETIDGVKKDLSSLTIKADEISSTVTRIDNDVKTAQSDISQTADSITAAVARIEAAENNIKSSNLTIESNYTSLSTQIESLDGEVQAKAEIRTSVQYNPETGKVTSEIKLRADQIDINGATTINNSFEVSESGDVTMREGVVMEEGALIGNLRVSGSLLTNENEDGNACIILINKENGTKAVLGDAANTLGVKMAGIFESTKKESALGGTLHEALLVSAQGAMNNCALGMDGGYVSGFAMKTRVLTASEVLARADYNIVCANSSEITLTLPEMQPHDDGHVIRIKRVGSAKVSIRLGYSNYYADTLGTVGRCRSFLFYNQGDILTGDSLITLNSCGDGYELVWCRELQHTSGSTTLHGGWVQYKFPPNW